MTKLYCLLIGLIALQPIAHAQTALPSFPGAEGAGATTTGGRGNLTTKTTVYEVTTLDDSTVAQPGSLRWALAQTATSRTIVFRVSGTIHLKAALKVTKANTTIAGQTAPGGGICLADYPVSLNANNIIVRYMRFRMGDKNQNKGMVNGSGDDDAFDGVGLTNIIIDHCTMSWSNDEACTFYSGDSLTLQWNMLSEPLNYSYHFETGDADYEHHGYGGIWGGRHASFHHNLLAHCQGRNPRFDGSRNLSPYTNGQENADFCNNVIYNWGGYSNNGGEGGNYNIVNNYYKSGPSTSTGSSSGVPIRYEIMNPYKTTTAPILSFPKVYLTGNYVVGSTNITNNNWLGIAFSGGSLADTTNSKATTPFVLPALTIDSATVAYAKVLAGAGAILPARDTLDQRIIDNVTNGTGRIIDVQGGYPHGTAYALTVNAWPALATAAAPTDSDHDGMPDYWETANNSNPNDASDRNDIASNNYTKLENYLNNISVPVGIGNDPIYQNRAFVSASPVPADNSLTIAYPSTTNATAQIMVYDVSGKKMLAETLATATNKTTVDISRFAPGTYFIVFRNGSESVSTRFIKQ